MSILVLRGYCPISVCAEQSSLALPEVAKGERLHRGACGNRSKVEAGVGGHSWPSSTWFTGRQNALGVWLC